MRPYVAVLQELWRFVSCELWQSYQTTNVVVSKTPNINALVALPTANQKQILPVVHEERSDQVESVMLPTTTILCDSRVWYIATTTPLRLASRIEIDSIIRTCHYGEAVTITKYSGRFAGGLIGTAEGWILKDALVSQKADVWPQWQVGREYTADDTETIKTRLLLGDVFGAREANVPLLVEEFLLAKLRSDNRFIVWTAHYNRVSALWHQLLRGVAGVRIGVAPVTDSIMEWQDDMGEWYRGYILKVAPDNTLTIATIGFTESDVYTEEIVTEIRWREWRPVFIEVT